MTQMLIKKGDMVSVIAGKDKGKRAKALQIMPKSGKIVVEGLNLLAKNVRPRRQGEKGQIIRYNAPMDISNVLLYCSHCGRGRRAGYLMQRDGKKTRVCKKCKQAIS